MYLIYEDFDEKEGQYIIKDSNSVGHIICKNNEEADAYLRKSKGISEVGYYDAIDDAILVNDPKLFYAIENCLITDTLNICINVCCAFQGEKYANECLSPFLKSGDSYLEYIREGNEIRGHDYSSVSVHHRIFELILLLARMTGKSISEIHQELDPSTFHEEASKFTHYNTATFSKIISISKRGSIAVDSNLFTEKDKTLLVYGESINYRNLCHYDLSFEILQKLIKHFSGGFSGRRLELKLWGNVDIMGSVK